MTFEQFVLSWTGRDIAYHENAVTTGIDFAREAWNAALASAQTVLDEHDFYQVAYATDYYGAYPAGYLERLKTPLEGSNDSEVVHG